MDKPLTISIILIIIVTSFTYALIRNIRINEAAAIEMANNCVGMVEKTTDPKWHSTGFKSKCNEDTRLTLTLMPTPKKSNIKKET